MVGTVEKDPTQSLKDFAEVFTSMDKKKGGVAAVFVRNEDRAKAQNILSECGFRVYESEEFGLFFGIDAAGFDFYEAYWIPLYRARGLQWHDPDTEKKEASA